MWKLYGEAKDAVAIETDYGTLASVLPDYAHIGLVKYIDYEREWLPEWNTFYPFMHKRKSFEHEREVRVVIQEHARTESGEFGLSHDLANPLLGVAIDIDVSRLVKRIYVSPTASPWFLDVVEATCKEFSFDFEVKKSNLNSDPVY
jgi:hypothetical protein